MIREIVHFVKGAPEMLRVQKTMPQSEFFDWMAAKADAQGFAEVRRELVGDLRGKVLEIGCGTGTMFQYYGPDVQVEGIEPDPAFLALALDKASKTDGKVHAAAGDGMNLAFPDASFDAVVFGLVLCSVPSVEKAVAEATRVLKPGGTFRALEHVRSELPVSGPLMDAFNPVWLKLNRQGCNWNRLPLPVIERAGLAVDDVRAFQKFDTVMPAFPMQRIRAHKPS